MQKYVTTRLTLLFALLLLSSPSAYSQEKEAESGYGDWMVACEDKQTSAKKCAMWQVAATADNAPRLLHVEISFQRPFAGAELLIILPLGISLPTAPSLYIDKKSPIQFQVEYCIADGCYIRSQMSAQLLEQFLHMNNAILRLETAEGHPIELPISGAGSRAAFNSTEFKEEIPPTSSPQNISPQQ